MVLAINKIVYYCKSTFDAILNETQFLLHGNQGTFAEVQTLNPIFDDFQA